jgi:chromosomal replication initiator protein
VRKTWEETLATLRSRVDGASFDRFLRRLRLVSVDGDTARLEAPDHLSLRWVSEELLDPIREALALHVGPRRVVLDLRKTKQGELFPIGRTRERRDDLERQRFSFDTFVVGASNQFAHAACLAVARQPGEHYNPLLIYGGTGLGKTHLALAVANAIAATLETRVVYVSADQFTSELIEALRRRRMTGFKRHYRSADVLIIDDIQGLAGRDRSQEELFHTFNTLHDAGRQILLTSDRVPEEIPGLEKRLRNRFQWGLVADLQPPDLETRVAILERKAEEGGVHLPEDAAMLLAEHIPSNIRGLEAAMTRVAAAASLSHRSISANYVQNLITQGELSRHGAITFDEIAQAVCERYGLSIEQLLSRRRTKNVAVPRQVAMYLCRRLLEASYPKIGGLFRRDHTTALHGVKAVSTKLKEDAALQATIDTLQQRLETR